MWKLAIGCRPTSLYAEEIAALFIVDQDRLIAELVWTGRRREKHLPVPGIESRSSNPQSANVLYEHN
jgi:hypothetical protein